ncbi:uncharacterized protein LOC135098508 [Scylla paramamosain]|uniref:uncharacterized protein LOC135098508 n=1 Tax=Scylla paramamosain TaxID=85552 RepID=UPI003082F24E
MPVFSYKLGNEEIKVKSEEKDPGITVTDKLSSEVHLGQLQQPDLLSLDLHGSFHNSKHCKLDHTDLVSSEAKSGNVFTKAFVGGVPCDIVDDNLELCDTLTREKVTCRSKAKLVGPMNVTVCVTGRGVSEVTKIGRYVDSQDRLYQFLTYAGVYI